MPDEEAAEFDTPWRRSLDEIEPALVGLGARPLRRARRGRERGIARATACRARPCSSTCTTSPRAASTTTSRASRRSPTSTPSSPTTTSSSSASAWTSCARDTDVPAPEVAFFERDTEWLRTPFLVMRRIDGEAPPDIPPYVFGGWVMDATPEQRRAAAGHDASSVLARLHEITPATHDLSFLAQPQHGASALDQQLGYQRWYYEWARNGVSYPLIERTLAWLDDQPPARGRPGAQLGRRADRQRALRRLRAGRGARLGDGDGRATRGRPRVDDLPRHVLRRPRASASRCRRSRGSWTATTSSPTYEQLTGHTVQRARVVRGARRAALRDRVGAHEHARHRLRADGAARRPRRPHHVPQPARAHAGAMRRCRGPNTRARHAARVSGSPAVSGAGGPATSPPPAPPDLRFLQRRQSGSPNKNQSVPSVMRRPT